MYIATGIFSVTYLAIYKTSIAIVLLDMIEEQIALMHHSSVVILLQLQCELFELPKAHLHISV